MAEDKEKKFHYGGQAVIEGVMMRGPKDFAVAVRRADGEIVTTREDVESVLGKLKWLNKPFLRGTLALSRCDGARHQGAEIRSRYRHAGRAGGDKGDPEDAESSAQAAKPQTVNDMTVSAIMVVGLILGVALFMLVPILIVRPLRSHGLHGWQLTALEGCVKIAIFFIYVSLISLMKDIRRVFQYHGAEHKTINAYEAAEDLTVANVDKYSTVHVRCGTSFILVVLFTSIVVFMFISWKSILMRFVYKLLLLPLVAGIAYEVIRFAGGRKESAFMRMVLAPGLLMQKITTKEPEPEMIEVAIRSLQSVLEKEAAHESSGPAEG